MCNTTEGPKLEMKRTSGYGWKLVRPGFTGLVGYRRRTYLKDPDGWVRWNPALANYNEVGFCAFATKKEAIRALRAWPFSKDGVHIESIQYKKAVCRKLELNFVEGKTFTVILVKEFRFLNEQKGT